MTKQEKIRDAYKEVGLPFPENIIYDNGWSNIKPTQYQLLYDKCDVLKLTNHVHKIRPKSLQGIEDNNGWIKIKSEDDLPKKGTNCHFILKNGVCGVFVDIGDSEYLTLRNRGTHYQPIVKPKPPIY